MENRDANCRLIHQLNGHCLAKIFQCLDSVDLYTMADMNEVYYHIIHDLVIPRHTINFSQLHDTGISMAQVFERYGTKIKKFRFHEHLRDAEHSINKLSDLIYRHCAIDQLQSVEIACNLDNPESIELPIHFRGVEKFIFRGNFKKLTVQLNECVRYLHISNAHLGPCFDWSQMQNLKEIYLNKVNGINVQSFVELCRRHRPKIETFKQYNLHNFSGGSIDDMCDAIAKYCGNEIREYHGMIYPMGQMLPLNLYGFLAKFTNINSALLVSNQMCFGDLIDGLKELAENDTIEILRIHYGGSERNRVHVNCNFQEKPYLQRSVDMKQFNRLKMIRISGELNPNFAKTRHRSVCNPFRILNVFGSRILSNVDQIIIDTVIEDLDFLKFATKLRYLTLCDRPPTFNQQIAPILENIYEKRQKFSYKGDFIKVKFISQPNYLLTLKEKETK